jgi:hypothetical protein
MIEILIRRQCYHLRAESWTNATGQWWKCPDCQKTVRERHGDPGWIYEWMPLHKAMTEANIEYKRWTDEVMR